MKNEKAEKKPHEYPNGKRPRKVEFTEFMETKIDEDRKKHKRNFQPHVEHIIEQYCKGNIMLKVEGTNLWYGIDTPAMEIEKINNLIAISEEVDKKIKEVEELSEKVKTIKSDSADQPASEPSR